MRSRSPVTVASTKVVAIDAGGGGSLLEHPGHRGQGRRRVCHERGRAGSCAAVTGSSPSGSAGGVTGVVRTAAAPTPSGPQEVSAPTYPMSTAHRNPMWVVAESRSWGWRAAGR